MRVTHLVFGHVLVNILFDQVQLLPHVLWVDMGMAETPSQSRPLTKEVFHEQRKHLRLAEYVKRRSYVLDI